ncbi:transketolase family protein [Paludibaculum fermentans]|uniref:transketolase family protein n=1 Tax=Paludibaculum fermentans TaxID=1473598 RepID=UPI003EB7C750
MSTSPQLFDCRDAFARTLEEVAAADVRIVAVVNDSLGSSKMGGFRKLFPQRLVNVGIAEQNMVGVGCGLANGGMIPFVCGAACFLTGRAMEQVKVDLAYSKSNVKLCGMSGGMAYGPLGPTHHSIEDLAWTRVLPNMTVIVPADPYETEQALRAALALQGPVYLRLSRMGVPNVHGAGQEFRLGRATRLREGGDVTLIANGTMVCRALEAADLLEQVGVQARVLNMATLRPLDEEAIAAAAEETGCIVTAEEHLVHGGLGSAVAEVVTATVPVPVRMVGVRDAFAPTGSTAFLFQHFGLTAEAIRDAGLEAVKRKARKC